MAPYQISLITSNLHGMTCYYAEVGVTMLRGCWWRSGSSGVSHHCDLGSIPAPCSYLIKVTFVTYEKNVVHFDSTKHQRFSPGTLVSSGCNTGSMRGDLTIPLGRTA